MRRAVSLSTTPWGDSGARICFCSRSYRTWWDPSQRQVRGFLPSSWSSLELSSLLSMVCVCVCGTCSFSLHAKFLSDVKFLSNCPRRADREGRAMSRAAGRTRGARTRARTARAHVVARSSRCCARGRAGVTPVGEQQWRPAARARGRRPSRMRRARRGRLTTPTPHSTPGALRLAEPASRPDLGPTQVC